MIEYINKSIIYKNGVIEEGFDKRLKYQTLAYQIMNNHNVIMDNEQKHLVFDALVSHDITYVGIIQSAKASGLKKFPVPYALTNCHNSLCAVGGTINEDDHIFGLSAAKKYGGIYVPANFAVIHQYVREMMAKGGNMILGSDSHTRYGALGCMGIGEGGPELVKQLLENTYDITNPEVVLIHVTGKLNKGVGPHDVALVLCKLLFGKVKNCVLEFAGEGIANLSIDERMGIDVMTTETGCLSSIWETDESIELFYINHQRKKDYVRLNVNEACYDSYVELNLSEVECMIALPFHPSNAFTIHEVLSDPEKYLRPVGLESKIVDGKVKIDQAVIAGCAGGLYENIEEANAILKNSDNNMSVMVYPASAAINSAIIRNGIAAELIDSGAVIKPAFCGPCFGAGDVPGNNCLSIRHSTRNFPNREGSKPMENQMSYVALMDARSIAASVANGGFLTPATEIDYDVEKRKYVFNDRMYKKYCYNGVGINEDIELVKGPNITDWPEIEPLKDNLLVKLTAVIDDEVTTTDELIPSGETSSYRSNPLRLAKFTLSRRVPEYVDRCNEAMKEDISLLGYDEKTTSFGSAIYANKPGDGSAREQAASCQRVLGGAANFCKEFATKRYRSNCINWGIMPFTCENFNGKVNDYVYVPGIKNALENGDETIIGYINDNRITLYLKDINKEERDILLAGNLMNYYKKKGQNL